MYIYIIYSHIWVFSGLRFIIACPGRDSWNTQSVAAMAMHGRAWQLASKLLQQRFWSKGLEPWEATMRQHHEENQGAAKCLQTKL